MKQNTLNFSLNKLTLIKSRIIFSLLLLSLFACKTEPNSSSISSTKFRGETMGTYYAIAYNDKQQLNYQAEIDLLLEEINKQLSTYIPSSTISKFNSQEEGVNISSTSEQHFKAVFNMAKEIFLQTEGAFDPTVMPLVNYWGFGYAERNLKVKDNNAIDSLLQFVGFDKVESFEMNDSEEIQYQKDHPKTQLDFSAIAKGYGVDQIGKFLEKKGIKDYLIDIGGEIRARGKSRPDKEWTVGINTPKEGGKMDDIHAVILLKDRSIASSGNYRNFYEQDGIKYAHTINPKTGFSELNQLLSASIIAGTCMEADAFATACMVAGLEKSIAMIEARKGLEAYFIYGDEHGNLKTHATKGMSDYLVAE